MNASVNPKTLILTELQPRSEQIGTAVNTLLQEIKGLIDATEDIAWATDIKTPIVVQTRSSKGRLVIACALGATAMALLNAVAPAQPRSTQSSPRLPVKMDGKDD